jgi:hypothetical protein
MKELEQISKGRTIVAAFTDQKQRFGARSKRDRQTREWVSFAPAIMSLLWKHSEVGARGEGKSSHDIKGRYLVVLDDISEIFRSRVILIPLLTNFI